MVKLSRSSSLDPSDFPLVAWISREGTELLFFPKPWKRMEALEGMPHMLCVLGFTVQLCLQTLWFEPPLVSFHFIQANGLES